MATKVFFAASIQNTSFVATNMELVATPANDNTPASLKMTQTGVKEERAKENILQLQHVCRL